MFNRIMALLWLRCQIIFSNKSILLQILLPFAYAYFYKYLMDTQGETGEQQLLALLAMCLPFSLTLAVGNPVTVILSEEKEKHNLRTLLVSGVKGYEYIVSTLILPLLLTFVIMGVIPLILGVAIDNILNYSVIVFLTAIVIILLYLLLGLVAKSQVAAQVISLPVTLLVAFLPMMTDLDKSVAKVADYSFMGLFIKFLTKWEDFSWVKSLIPSLSLAVWIILLVFCNFLVIKKRNTV